MYLKYEVPFPQNAQPFLKYEVLFCHFTHLFKYEVPFPIFAHLYLKYEVPLSHFTYLYLKYKVLLSHLTHLYVKYKFSFRNQPTCIRSTKLIVLSYPLVCEVWNRIVHVTHLCVCRLEPCQIDCTW
jgi:hypothetical protein